MSTNSTGARVAVLARVHRITDKEQSLFEGLAGGEHYDFYVTPNVNRGPLEIGDYPAVPHSNAHYNALGFDGRQEYFLMHCADLLFASIRSQIPDYDHYVVVEYDVDFVRPAREFMDRLAQALTSDEYRDVDLAGTQVSRRGDEWMWAPNVAQSYPEVWGVFYPFVVMSGRAIDHLLEVRREERRLTGRTEPNPTGELDNLMYCEAFTASALKGAETFRLLDLADMFPGCYQYEYFTIGLPRLLGEPLDEVLPSVEIVHPVYGQNDFLERHWGRLAGEPGGPSEFRSRLERAAPYLRPELLREFQARAERTLLPA
jgi:hypothetical protein